MPEMLNKRLKDASTIIMKRRAKLPMASACFSLRLIRFLKQLEALVKKSKTVSNLWY